MYALVTLPVCVIKFPNSFSCKFIKNYDGHCGLIQLHIIISIVYTVLLEADKYW